MSARRLSLIALTISLVLLLPGSKSILAWGDSSNSPSSQEEILRTREEAKRMVIYDILSDDISGKAIHMVESPISKGTIVKGWKADVETFVMPYEKGWFFFLDDYRMANWEHPCRYVFVDSQAKEYTVFQATTPPKIWERYVSPQGEIIKRRLELEEIEESIRQRPKEEESEEVGERDWEFGELLGQMSSDDISRHVVLISGGYDGDANYSRYLKDLRHHYVTLKKYGYSDEQIDVLYADGSSADLDCDTDNDIDGNALKTTVQAALNALPSFLDYLHVYVTDHGGTGSGPDGAQYGDSRIWLWNQEWISDVEMANLISSRNPECASYVLEQCYSGGFIDDLLTTAGKVVISTACRGDEFSWACDTEGDFDEFVYHYTSALRLARPSGDTPAQICLDGIPVYADANGNGMISLKEAYDYALTKDSAPENPQIAQMPTGQADGAWLGGCEGASVLRGDANGDGAVDPADVVYLINYLFKEGPVPDPLEAGDVNCDDVVDPADVVYLINYLFQGGPPPCSP
jgi:hypothetical protein